MRGYSSHGTSSPLVNLSLPMATFSAPEEMSRVAESPGLERGSRMSLTATAKGPHIW